MAIKIGGNAYNVNISSEINRETARRFYEQKSDKANNAKNIFKPQAGFDPKKNKAEIENRLEHIVCRSVTKLFDTMADILKDIKEKKRRL